VEYASDERRAQDAVTRLDDPALVRREYARKAA
jgi:hypothetical protein